MKIEEEVKSEILFVGRSKVVARGKQGASKGQARGKEGAAFVFPDYFEGKQCNSRIVKIFQTYR